MMANSLKDIYPMTITMTRYQGVYEHGAWAAFHEYPENLPKDAFSDDVTCAIWWSENRDVAGVGQTPEAALHDLLSKMDKDVS